MINLNEMWVWLIVGLLPYRLQRTHSAGGGYTLAVKAIFWSLLVRRQANGPFEWTVRVPLIELLGLW